MQKFMFVFLMMMMILNHNFLILNLGDVVQDKKLGSFLSHLGVKAWIFLGKSLDLSQGIAVLSFLNSLDDDDDS
jgi:hypothetical protein